MTAFWESGCSINTFAVSPPLFFASPLPHLFSFHLPFSLLFLYSPATSTSLPLSFSCLCLLLHPFLPFYCLSFTMLPFETGMPKQKVGKNVRTPIYIYFNPCKALPFVYVANGVRKDSSYCFHLQTKCTLSSWSAWIMFLLWSFQHLLFLMNEYLVCHLGANSVTVWVGARTMILCWPSPCCCHQRQKIELGALWACQGWFCVLYQAFL